jgi:hypothetical protein
LSIEKDDIPQLLRDLKISREIEDAFQILDLNRDGKWSLRLLLLSYLLKERELKTIREFVDFGFSKTAEDSLFSRFNFQQIGSALAMPDKWFKETAEYISGSGNARSLLSKRSDLFYKIGSSYTLNEKSGARNLALLLFLFLIRAYKIDLIEIPMDHGEEGESIPDEVYYRLFLIDSTGVPTRFIHEVQTIIENHPILAQESEFDRDTRSILPYIQTAIFNLLLKHNHAFSKAPRKKKLEITTDTIYSLSAFENDERFDILSWLNRQQEKRDIDITKIDEERIEESIPTVAVLIGSAGSGKSFWMVQQTCDLWNASFKSSRTRNKHRNWIPIFLELGDMFLDSTKRGEALVYGEEKDPLWFNDEEPDEISRSLLISRSLEAMVKKLHGYVPKILDRIDWELDYVIFLDGWDELGPLEMRELVRFIKSCHDNELPCIISSRTRDFHFEEIEPTSLKIEAPSIDRCTDYLRFRGMEADVLDNVDKWFPNLSPLDLEILGRVPKMAEISYGRVPVYRSWIELQVLSSIQSNIPQDIQSRSEIDQIIEGNVYAEKSLKEWIRSFELSNSVWSYLPYIAYLQREGRNTSLSYDQVVQDNPLLKDLLEKRYGSGDSPHPEISRNNLIPYLSAEYIFRSYLSGRYPPIRGDLETFRFLVEILSYDLERRHKEELIQRSVELTPLDIAAMICIQGESDSYDSGMDIQPIRPEIRSRTTPSYNAIFDGLVRYWNQSQDQQSRRRILEPFSRLLRTIIMEGTEETPEYYIVPLIEIERALRALDISKLTTDEPDQSIDLEVRDSSGYLLRYYAHHKVQNWLLQITSRKPWLAPWTVRVIDQESQTRIREIIDEVHDEQLVYDVLSYVTHDFTSIDSVWLQNLHRNAMRLQSGLIWNSLAFGFLRSKDDLDETRFSQFLEIIGSSYVEEKWKLELIYDLRRKTLPERYTREVWRATEHGEIAFKHGIAICLSQELPEISLDDIFDAIQKSDGWEWLGLLLPGLLKEEYNEEEVDKRFVDLSYTIVQTIRRIRVAPWDEERLSNLIDLWWETNLQTVDDAMDLLYTISKQEREDGRMRIDYRETVVLERIASWLNDKRKSTKKKFFRKLIESEIDMMDFQIQNHLYPIYEGIDNRIDLDNLLVERYPSPTQGLLRLPLSRESWVTHIDKVDWQEILEWSYFMEVYLEAGLVKTIEEGIKILDEIMALGNYLTETFDPLVKWLLQRPKNEIAAFTLRLLEESPTSTRIGYWRQVKDSGLIETLSPISKNSPEVYTRILEIATEMPILTIDIRSEIQFLFEQLTPDDQLRIVRPHIEKFLGRELFFFRTPLAELILLHGTKKDVDILVRSLNEEPRKLGDIWLKNPERSKAIYKRLSNSLSKLLYEIDMTGGWDKYKIEIGQDPKKAEEGLLIFLNNDWVSTGYSFLTSGGAMRDAVLKHWKRVFLSDKTSRGEKDLFLGDLFEMENDEIVHYIAGEVDRIHKNLKRDREEPRAYRTPWYSWIIPVLDKIRERCGYPGLKQLLAKVKDPYAIEGVMTYLVGAAKQEGVPKSEILSMNEYKKLSKETRWYLIRDYEEKKENGSRIQ